MAVPTLRQGRPVVAVIDWNIVPSSPAGSVVAYALAGLKDEFDFVVFAGWFDNPNPDRISYIHVPVPLAPGFVKDTVFPYLLHWSFGRWRRSNFPPDLVLATQGQYRSPDVSYAHFCHRAFLREHWQHIRPKGLRRLTGRFAHEHNAFRERLAFRKAREIVVPSAGLRDDLLRTYPYTAGKVRVIPNPVDLGGFRPPAGLDKARERAMLGLREDVFVFVFVALGNFAHKGIDLALHGIARADDPRATLLVVGGGGREVSHVVRKARALGVERRVVCAGLVSDVRRFLWASDVFVLPSRYETFSLSTFQAAASGLPLIATPVYGVEEIMVDGQTGWRVERTTASVARAMREAASEPRGELERMGNAAAACVREYDLEHFVDRWRECFSQLLRAPEAPRGTPE